MAMNFMVPLRIAQWILAILVLGTGAYVASWYNGGSFHTSPAQFNFLIFTGIWTALIVIPYLTISPRFFPTAAHKFGILAAEAITMLFWFGGWVATAVFMAGLGVCRGSVCRSAQATVVFGAAVWVLFVATTIMAVLYCFRTGGSSRPNRAKDIRVVNSV